MDNTLLYTLPQWFIFAGIFVIVYGWVEKKKVFRIIGMCILLALGIFSIATMMGDTFAASELLTNEEIYQEDVEDKVSQDVPFEAKILPAYWTFILAILFVIPGIILDIRNSSRYKIFIILATLTVLLGFFWVVGAINSL